VGDLRFVRHDLGTLPKLLGSLTTPQAGVVSLSVRDGVCVSYVFLRILILFTPLQPDLRLQAARRRKLSAAPLRFPLWQVPA
jgi:hypothetical protein